MPEVFETSPYTSSGTEPLSKCFFFHFHHLGIFSVRGRIRTAVLAFAEQNLTTRNTRTIVVPSVGVGPTMAFATTSLVWPLCQFGYEGVLVACLRSRTRYTGRLSSDFHGHLASARGNLTNDQFGSSPLNQKSFAFSPNKFAVLDSNGTDSWYGVNTNPQPLCAPCRA